MAVDGLIIPRSYNDYFSRTEITQFNNAVKATTDAELNPSSAFPVQNKAIAELVPTQASSTNKLADKEFVNSSVSTNTANYISDDGEPFASVAALEAYSGTVTNNDYAFVTGTDSAGNTYYDRYKATVSGNTVTWAKEYRLNNSSFTAAQWDAIQSGITAAKVAQYDAAVGSNTVVPVGTISAYYGSTDPADGQWLICDGRDTTGTAIELETHYPSLYIFLGGTNVLPDLRELTLVGAGQNGTETIAAHDVYTLGQFKDDQLQNFKATFIGVSFESTTGRANEITGAIRNTAVRNANYSAGGGVNNSLAEREIDPSITARAGTTTHGKQKGVNWIIKAISSTDTQPIPSTDIQTIEQYFDNGIQRVEQDIQAAQSYSTTETLTGGTWIDGKPIYRKVINTTSLANNTVLIQNVDTVINSGGTAGTSAQMQPYPFPMSGYTKHWDLTSTGDLKYRCDSTTAIVQIWFEYTKTTD